ncbi:hypothetical protein [Candidatus Poriferisodalis sp.]|uniref:hypothetical protein n=1 Tax=Candidatus Poriferisodalis sp. TaxID=3101277 RepID=UPI003C6F28F0
MSSGSSDEVASPEAEVYAARTCSELSVGRGRPSVVGTAEPLRTWRDLSAYVLLGDAGAGKSTEFMREWRELGNDAVFRSAREFVALEVDPDWCGKTVFIDGLDEIRAGSDDKRLPLDGVRRKLQQLQMPRFRISCREADWLGNNDRNHLDAVAPDLRIGVLRLNPLTEEAAVGLLASRLGEHDGQDLAERARQHGVGSMLTNPLTLDLLVAAFSENDSGGPRSRREVFERACGRMAQEHNSEHRVAAAQHPVNDIITAAGELCARQLLVGIEGFSVDVEDEGSAFVSLDTLVPIAGGSAVTRPELWRTALRTKLFVAPVASPNAESVRLVPRHRQVAEYLGGRFLATLIDAGLPARRVAALLTSPSDARVVTSLRGLSAWLAAHSPEALEILVESDPVGLGLYGDINGLTADQKQRLLYSLAANARLGPLLGHERRDNRTSDYSDSTPWAFRSVATADTATAISDLLSDRNDAHASERIAEFLLEVLASSETDQVHALTGLVPQIEAMVQDSKHETVPRRAALDAHLRLTPSGPERCQHLIQMLESIRSGAVSDPDDELAGTLLRELYPETVSPAVVWQYLRIQNRTNLYGRFQHFWHQELRKKSTHDEVIELLDAFAADAADLLQPLEAAVLDRFPRQLLADALDTHGDEITLERLFGWLSAVGASMREFRFGSDPTDYEAAAEDLAFLGESLGYSGAAEELREPIRKVRAWLEARPDLQKAIFLLWLRTRDKNGPLGVEAYWQCEALCQSKYPSDFGPWCLQSAIELADCEPDIADELLRHSYRTLSEPAIGADLSIETMTARVADSHRLRELLEDLRRPSEWQQQAEEFERQRRERAEQRDAQRRADQQEWDTHLRDNRSQLSENAYPAALLGRLGKAYFGLYRGVDRHTSGAGRVSEFIGGDTELVEAVLEAFRRAILRPEVPEVDETISLRTKSQHSWLAYPVLAGLQLMDAEDPETLDAIDDTLKRKALALHYCVPTNEIMPPPWHERWAVRDPELVADAICRCAMRAVRNDEGYLPGLNELESIPGHDELKHTVRLKLLESFPTRATGDSLRNMDRLLTAALEWHTLGDLRALIQRKTALKSMPISQRLHWLAAGWLAPDPRCSSELRRLIREREARIQNVAEFLRNASDAGMSVANHLSQRVDSTTRSEFVSMLGTAFPPVQRSGKVTVEMELSEIISSAIFGFRSESAGSTDETLKEFLNDPRLAAWKEHLRHADEQQRVVERDASYRALTMENVQRTLSGSVPANAADLTALVLDRLEDIRAEARGSATNLWSSFWNVDQRGEPDKPKPENSCRDFLLAELRRRLPRLAAAMPEAMHAAETRADIGVRYASSAVPIEIKRSMSDQLRTGLRQQLIEKYSTDPDAEGHGIYIALWFGPDQVNASLDRDRPRTPQELRQRLEADLSTDEMRKISVIVLDVTKPGDRPDVGRH